MAAMSIDSDQPCSTARTSFIRESARIFLVLVFFYLSQIASAQVSVVSTIRPLEFIASAIVGNGSDTVSLIDYSDSPHSFSLTPQDRLAIEQADILLWIAPEFELYLEDLFSGLENEKQVITVSQLPEITLHDFEDGNLDPHLWLDPGNGILIATALVTELSKIYPQQEQELRERLSDFKLTMNNLERELAQTFSQRGKTSYLVYHQAYQYFEAVTGLQNSGELLHNPEVEPGMRELLELRALVSSSDPACIILEPDSSEALVNTLVQESSVKRVTIDLLGYNIPDSESAYRELLESVASGFKACFSADQ